MNSNLEIQSLRCYITVTPHDHRAQRPVYLDNIRLVSVETASTDMPLSCSLHTHTSNIQHLPTVTATVPSLVRYSTSGPDVNPDPKTSTRLRAPDMTNWLKDRAGDHL